MVVCIAASYSQLFAQQDPLFTQYLDNQMYANPAFAGSKEHMVFNSIHRQQWVGIAGAPQTTTFNLHTPLPIKSLSIGADVLSDKIGPLNRLNASLNVAYRIKFGNGKLSLGLKGGVDNYRANIQEIDRSAVDNYANNLSGAMAVNFGFGAYYFAEQWFAGIAIPRITGELTDSVGGVDNGKHFFAIGGALFGITPNWQIRPSAQLRMIQGSPISADLTATAIWNQRLWAGLNYRLEESASVFVQFKIIGELKLGYAFDLTTNRLNQRTAGSHEILLSYGFVRNISGLVSPKYF